MNEHRSKQWGDTSQLTHNITLYFNCLAVMLADQTKVSPWINADSSVDFPFLSLPTAEEWGGRGGGGGTHRHPVGDDNVTRCGAPVTSQDTGNLCWSGGAAAFISAKTSTAHSLDILRAKLTLLQCARVHVELERAERVRTSAVCKQAAGSRSSAYPHASAHGIPTRYDLCA